MTMLDDMPDLDTPAPDEAPAAGGDLRSRLRAARAKSLDEHRLALPVPGYPADLELVVQFHPLGDGRELEEIGKKAMKEQEGRELAAVIDTIIAACEGIYLREDDGSLVGLHVLYELGDQDRPVRFSDPRLAEALEFDAPTTRDAVRAVFRENDAAILSVGEQLGRWLPDVTKQVDRRLLGE